MDWLWTWDGVCFGYRDGHDLWTPDGRHVGRFAGKEVYGRNGVYLGELMGRDRLIASRAKMDRLNASFLPLAARAACPRPAGRPACAILVGYTDFPMPETLR
jgi:hypothetical protein